ncbi:MAG: molybdopterin molybdotransferase MoeA, partial [Acidobacteria bacterium]|nr:molybdopterin molybdotransferase MoeA [Acidobacteriota bacterium]
DGYAIRSSDVGNLPVELEVVGELKAGNMAGSDVAVEEGRAFAIMTGAPVPRGADAVIMVEHTRREGTRVELNHSVASGENIVPRGAEARRGQELLSPGTILDPASIALAASAGRPRLLVYAKPRIAILATGDELVDLDLPPAPHQIRNSNSYSLAAQIEATGADPVLLPIAPDEPGRLNQLLREGLEADLLLISGGVSMGKYDLVEQVLSELKAEFIFTGAEIQPGRPIVFGQVPAQPGECSGYFFGLPGNPVSTLVTYDLFARPFIEALMGKQPGKLRFVYVRLSSPIRTKTGLRRFLPALLSGEFEHAEVELIRWQGSGDLAALARSNAYVVVPSDREQMAAGEWAAVLLRG